MNKNNHINYIEFKTHSISETKKFYSEVFGWKFTDFGEKYTAFEASGVLGGFEETKDKIENGVLIVLYHEDLEKVQKKIIQHGGKVIIDTFEFPGGKRFEFLDHSGNQLAVWSDK